MARARNITMIEVLRSSKIRVGELVREEHGYLLYEMRAVVVEYAKGKNERAVFFSAQAWEAIQRYLQARSELVLCDAATQGCRGPELPNVAPALSCPPTGGTGVCLSDAGILVTLRTRYKRAGFSGNT